MKYGHRFLLFVFFAMAQVAHAQKKPVNVIVILADDLGYGDLGCYGHPTIETPQLDRMAAEGMKFTQFYAAANVCTPSRAALLTGRLPVRNGMAGSDESGNVLYPFSTGGLPQSEITIARALKSRNYHTAIIGKWHLGHLPEFLPTRHGFDEFFGIPYSNDMFGPKYRNAPPLPLYDGDKVIETNPDQRLLTKRYTEAAIDFIRRNKSNPFFLYYPNNFPHVPLFASEKFLGKSKRGLYGDVVTELDWSVGQILQTVKDLGLAKNTLIVFMSDNGPWIREKQEGGSAGLLFEGKGSTYEGGMRVPAIAWWPGTIQPMQTNTSLATTMDLYPTILKLANATIPGNVILDGVDILPLLKGEKASVRDEVFYYSRDKLYAVRKGPWKAHFITRLSYSKEPPVEHEVPLLFNLGSDPSEKYDVSADHPDIIAALKKVRDDHRSSLTPVVSQLDGGYKRETKK